MSLILESLFKVFFKFLISSKSLFFSLTLFKIYSLFKLRSRICATYSACSESIENPFIKFKTTSCSFSVFLIIAIARSMSNKILFSPSTKCNFSSFFKSSKLVLFLTHSCLNLCQLFIMSLIPITQGTPSTKTLKLQAYESSSGVYLKSLFIKFLALVPLFRSIVIFSPFKSVSSLTSEISLILFSLIKEIILSIIASTVVVYGISVMSMQPFSLSIEYLLRILKEPLPVL